MTLCLWCSDEGTRLCDAALGGMAAAGMKGRWVYTGAIFTCDAPMCARHSKIVGHMCGKDGDFIEHCPHCVAHTPTFQPMHEHEAEALRRQRHAEARRLLIRLAHQPSDLNKAAQHE